MKKSSNPTALGRWNRILEENLPPSVEVGLGNVHMVTGFENAGFSGLLTTYKPEEELDLSASYEGREGEIKWRHYPELDGMHTGPVDLGELTDPLPWSVAFMYAEIECETAQIGQLCLDAPEKSDSPTIVWAWVNGNKVLAPMIPRQTNFTNDTIFIALKPGRNKLLFKLHFCDQAWRMEWHLKTFGSPRELKNIFTGLAAATDDATRLMAKYTLVELDALTEDNDSVKDSLRELASDSFATRWDTEWTESLGMLFEHTGSYLPIHDVVAPYMPVEGSGDWENMWPQSQLPKKELKVVDVSSENPQTEFAVTVLQGLVNRNEPELYVLHTRYSRQDGEWLGELNDDGFESSGIPVPEVWERYADKVKGAVIYDGGIMDEIGRYHSDRLNQTNVIMMICSLEDAVPLTPEMNETLKLPVVFDARGKWKSQYEMMNWAYRELFPKMNQEILATNYPGIFLITDYLVSFKIFTFWFPQYRTVPEENLLNGILASTPPNTPIIGWWFDWMPNPKDPNLRMADAVMEEDGMLRGSCFGKILTPSHEAANLTVHSGVPLKEYKHPEPDVPEYDENKIYYSHILSDGDNLGEALMLRTRDLQWDKPERGSIPIGWSFAPAAAKMAPTVNNYYMSTLSKNDLLVGGLGVGYTEPIIYLRAYPFHRDELYKAYAKMTDEAMKWIDTSCLWLINATDAEEDIYAGASSGQLRGIFTGYGGAPFMANCRKTVNDVVTCRSAVGFKEGLSREALIEDMVESIKSAASDFGQKFIESWVLNWDWDLEMLNEVDEILGDDYICVRPDVLVQLKQKA